MHYYPRLVSSPALLPSAIVELVDQKKFDELEDLWTARMESDPTDLDFFFALASAVKKKGGSGEAVSWLRFLADYQAERDDQDARLSVLTEIARMAPTDADIRSELETALRDRFAGHPAYRAVLDHNPISGSDPAAAAARVRRWLSFVPGDIYAMAGRGAGRVVELNPALDVIRVEFGGIRVPFSLVSGEKSLMRLPPGHFLRTKLEDPASLQRLAEEDPAESVRRQLESFGRPLTTAEIRENMSGLVDESRWTNFWAAARRHPQLLLSGAGKAAAVSWSASAGDAEESLRREFEEAEPPRKIELARKNAKRSKELARLFADGLAESARAASGNDPALAWELSQAAVRLAPDLPEAYPPDNLASLPDLPRLLAQIRDHVARERAVEEIRLRRPDWYEILSAHFAREEDGRVLAALYDRLGEQPERREELRRRVLRSPRTAARAFVWFAERAQSESPASVPPSVFFGLLDALRQEEFSGLRTRVKEFFEPGGLAVSLARSAASEEEARELLSALERAGGLEEHRRGVVREALLMKFPELRAPAREYLYSTPEAIEERRRELAHLKSVELPANSEAMRAAKEHGDLSENFEYHAARQRHEYLSARIASLADELSRARALDSSRIDVSEIRVGTRVVLREIATGVERVATILGPWDSRPEEAIYSYQSEFAQGLLGRRPGDRVALSDVEAEVVSIAPWR